MDHDYAEALKGAPLTANSLNVVADLHYRRGQMYERLEDFDHAATDYDKLVELKPGNAWVCNYVAWIYATWPPKFRSPIKALPLALKAVELKKDHYTELNNSVGQGRAQAGNRKIVQVSGVFRLLASKILFSCNPQRNFR